MNLLLGQCSMPVFEGILPNRHNKILLDLLFILAVWHAYAKLRLHTATTLRCFERMTKELGKQLRLFKRTTCTEYDTRELKNEVQARGRRQAAKLRKGAPTQNQNVTRNNGPHFKELNINTPKMHAIGKYFKAIGRFGTTDNCSTQVVCPIFFRFSWKISYS